MAQQTATAAILQVINRVQHNAQPVFDAIADSAAQLCGADLGGMFLVQDTQLYEVSTWSRLDPGLIERLRRVYPRPLDTSTFIGRSIMERRVFQIADMTDPTAPQSVVGLERLGFRSQLNVPIVRDGDAIGGISVVRQTPGLFSDEQIQLLKTFADQAAIAIENVRLFTELQTSNRELTTGLDKQTATSDILRVISQSPTEVQPVFDAIVESAVRLLGGHTSTLARIASDQIALVGLTSTDPAADAALRARFPQPLDSEEGYAQVIRARAPINIADATTDPRLPEVQRASTRARGIRSLVVVPLLRQNEAIGALGVSRREPGGFTADEIALLKTFADQAVIAIENARLFTELSEKNGALAEALEQQTATAEILRVISSSPTDLQPVFDTIVRNAVILCDATFGGLQRITGERMTLDAHHGVPPDELVVLQRDVFPLPISRESATGRAVLDRAVAHVPDIREDPEFRTPRLQTMQRYRAILAVPMMRDGIPIGALALWRSEVRRFSDAEIALVETFADQAVIAIENVRLLRELQASNRDLTTALDKQTATSDILRIISRSPTDVQPVFDAIMVSAVRLLRAYMGHLVRIAGDQIELVAHTSTDAAGDALLRTLFPRSLHSPGVHALAIRDLAPVNFLDVLTDPRLTEAQQDIARDLGYRSQVAVPLVRQGVAIGSISLTRRDPGGFTDEEIALLQTFADQAVIAIGNAHLLSELQARTQELTRSVEQLTALGDVGRAVSSSLDLDTVLTTIVGRAVQLSGTDGGTIFEYDEGAEEFAPRATLNTNEGQSATLRATRLRRGEGAVGQMAVTREPVQIPDISVEGAYESRLRGALIEAGTRAVLAIPLLHEERIVGGLVVTRRTPGAFTAEVVEILRTFATQSALALQNARLFREIEIKSRELEVASQHKSEFLANMSHELRTPLNAIIGYSELLEEEAEDLDGGRLVPDLQKIATAAKHQLSLINDILDLSKVEAGRMELDLSEFDVPHAIENALMLVRERASRRGIRLGSTIDERLGVIGGDERKVKQVLLNLLSNALKFTPEGGRIDVRAGVQDGVAEVSVTDTGVGIAPEDQEAVFEEFRQVGTAAKKVEGTGLGLALSRKFIELHGGRIWVQSQIGHGSTFTFTLPVRREE